MCRDIITFMTAWEVKKKKLGLGGRFAKTKADQNICNAYLTQYGGLLCTKPINVGDEIIRCADSHQYDAALERIDKLVVFSTDHKFECGRIGPEVLGIDEEDEVQVHFSNGSSRKLGYDDGLKYVYNVKKA